MPHVCFDISMDLNIDLGFAEKRNAAWLSNRYFPSKLGGQPAWLDVESLPTTQQLMCNKCQSPKSFLCQLYAPYEDSFNFHRTIYIFVCRNPDCQLPNDASNVTVLRSQLARQNKYYSDHEPAEDGEPLPAIQCVKKLCAACGCHAPHACSRCKSVHYCSAVHQRAHWVQHKAVCGNTAAANYKPMTHIEFPVYEIVMESNAKNSESDEDEDDIKEQRRRTEFAEMAASGKIGELCDVSEKELDKYFGNSANVDDKTFRHFKKETASEPEQVVRYMRGGVPLWITDAASTVKTQIDSVPNCSHCGGPRQFEFQIMPQMLVILEDERIDWGILAVYTCAKSCDIDGYVEEQVVKQDIVTPKF